MLPFEANIVIVFCFLRNYKWREHRNNPIFIKLKLCCDLLYHFTMCNWFLWKKNLIQNCKNTKIKLIAPSFQYFFQRNFLIKNQFQSVYIFNVIHRKQAWLTCFYSSILILYSSKIWFFLNFIHLNWDISFVFYIKNVFFSCHSVH